MSSQLNISEMVKVWNELIENGDEVLLVLAGLMEDWGATFDVIMKNQIIYTSCCPYVASYWATPQVIFGLANGLSKIICPIEDGNNASVVEDWIQQGCLGLVKKYEFKSGSWL